MAQIRLVPSTYSFSDTSYMSITDANNLYKNTDNTGYAMVTTSRNSTTTYYIYIKGFNFSDIPAGARVNSFTVKFRAFEQSLSPDSSYAPKLCNGTTTITSTCSPVGPVTQTLTFTGVSDSWDTIKGYGSNFGIRVSLRRSSRNTQGYLYVYGAEILVDYTIPEPENLYVKENGTWKEYSTVYKKVNGVWVEQTDLANLFDENTNYVKAN